MSRVSCAAATTKDGSLSALRKFSGKELRAQFSRLPVYLDMEHSAGEHVVTAFTAVSAGKSVWAKESLTMTTHEPAATGGLQQVARQQRVAVRSDSFSAQ